LSQPPSPTVADSCFEFFSFSFSVAARAAGSVGIFHPLYLANAAGPVPLVLDLRVAHDMVGSSADPALNGNLRYPNNLDQSLNDVTPDKIRKYRADYNNNPTRGVGFIPSIPSTSPRLLSEFIRILFLQAHRETDRFF
jgi:hypothetical protein